MFLSWEASPSQLFRWNFCDSLYLKSRLWSCFVCDPSRSGADGGTDTSVPQCVEFVLTRVQTYGFLGSSPAVWTLQRWDHPMGEEAGVLLANREMDEGKSWFWERD